MSATVTFPNVGADRGVRRGDRRGHGAATLFLELLAARAREEGIERLLKRRSPGGALHAQK
jgi:hypothetical protein